MTMPKSATEAPGLWVEDVAEYRKKIIMDGRCCKGSSYWLTSAPNRDLLTIIEPASFRVILK
jgi:hypothetical protein